MKLIVVMTQGYQDKKNEDDYDCDEKSNDEFRDSDDEEYCEKDIDDD